MLQISSWFKMPLRISFWSAIILFMLWVTCNASSSDTNFSNASSSNTNFCTASSPNTDFCFSTVASIKSANLYDPRLFYFTYPNGTIIDTSRTMMLLTDCINTCGASPVIYSFSDIEQRVNEWVVPLCILIGMVQ